MAWQTPKTNWATGDIPVADDFNRIEGNVQELQNTKETPAGAQAKAEAAAGVVQADLDAHLADIASQEVGKGADIIGLPDPNNLFTATNVGGAMNELFTNVSSGKDLVGGAITDVDDSVVIPTDPTFSDLAIAIGSISTGKKWASGTVIPSSTSISGYIKQDGTSATAYEVSVSDLNFISSIVLIYGKLQDGRSYLTVLLPTNMTSDYGYYRIITVIQTNALNFLVYAYRFEGRAQVNETGFILPLSTYNVVGNTLTYLAIE